MWSVDNNFSLFIKQKAACIASNIVKLLCCFNNLLLWLNTLLFKSSILILISTKIIPPFDYNLPALVNDHPNQDKTKQPICSVYPVIVIQGEVKEEGEEIEEIENVVHAG